MAKSDDISSTERLLELIRDNSQNKVQTAETALHQSTTHRIKSMFQGALSLKKSTTVGVDIGHEELKLAKIRHISYRRPELADYSRVPYEADIAPNQPEFVPFLKSTLKRFCGRGKKFEIWSNISSARVEIRYAKIPKVPTKQISNAVYWSHKRLAPHNEKETIFNYEILGDKKDAGAHKLEIISFTAPRAEVQNLKELFSKSGYPLTGIAIVPFAFQNLLRTRWVDTGAKNVSSLYIGRDWSRIDIYSGGNLVVSRGIKAGIKTMNAAIRGEIDAPLEISLEITDLDEAAETKLDDQKPQIDAERAQKIFFGLIHGGTPATPEETEFGPEEEEIFNLMRPALERLVRQVERTFEHFSANFENERVGKIYISSGMRPHQRIVDYIGDQLGLARESIDPFAAENRFLGDITGPGSLPERESFVPAMGMALSNNSLTPNFLLTYKEKAKAATTRLVSRIFLGVFMSLMVLCVGYFWWQGQVIDQKGYQVTRLRDELNRFQPPVDQNSILKLVEQAKQKNEIYREYSKKFIGIVVLREISNLTPANIRLLSITAQLGGSPEKTEEKLEKTLVLEGIILGNRLEFETSLAEYLIKLKDSPLFKQPVINKKALRFYDNKEVLRFTAQLNLS